MVVTLLTGCADNAKPALDKCEDWERKGDFKSAIGSCEEAVRLDPSTQAGKAAADRLPVLKQKLADKEKADALAKAEADRIAAERRAAQDAQDAKCSRWMTICTLGRFPDGSERTTGAQYFKTKSACASTGSEMGLRCDPCKCMD